MLARPRAVQSGRTRKENTEEIESLSLKGPYRQREDCSIGAGPYHADSGRTSPSDPPEAILSPPRWCARGRLSFGIGWSCSPAKPTADTIAPDRPQPAVPPPSDPLHGERAAGDRVPSLFPDRDGGVAPRVTSSGPTLRSESSRNVSRHRGRMSSCARNWRRRPNARSSSRRSLPRRL